MMRVALDTNILAYAEGLGDARRCGLAQSLVARLSPQAVILPAQTLGELFRVLTGKKKLGYIEAKQAVFMWADAFDVADSTWSAFQSAFDLIGDHPLAIWDALILSVAAEHKCRILLSEDFQDGFTWRGVTVINPFETRRNDLLAQVLLTSNDV